MTDIDRQPINFGERKARRSGLEQAAQSEAVQTNVSPVDEREKRRLLLERYTEEEFPVARTDVLLQERLEEIAGKPGDIRRQQAAYLEAAKNAYMFALGIEGEQPEGDMKPETLRFKIRVALGESLGGKALGYIQGWETIDKVRRKQGADSQGPRTGPARGGLRLV